MQTNKKKIIQILQELFNPEFLEVIDDSHRHSKQGDETHYRIIIVSDHFDGIRLVERHRLIQDAIESCKIYSLSIQAHTTKEWKGKIKQPPHCIGQ